MQSRNFHISMSQYRTKAVIFDMGGVIIPKPFPVFDGNCSAFCPVVKLTLLTLHREALLYGNHPDI